MAANGARVQRVGLRGRRLHKLQVVVRDVGEAEPVDGVARRRNVDLRHKTERMVDRAEVHPHVDEALLRAARTCRVEGRGLAQNVAHLRRHDGAQVVAPFGVDLLGRHLDAGVRAVVHERIGVMEGVVHAVHRRAQRVDHLEPVALLVVRLAADLSIVVVELLELVERERLHARAERCKVFGFGGGEEIGRAVLHKRGHKKCQRNGAEDGSRQCGHQRDNAVVNLSHRAARKRRPRARVCLCPLPQKPRKGCL